MDNKQRDPDVIGGEVDESEDKDGVNRARAPCGHIAKDGEHAAETKRPAWIDPYSGS